MNKKISLGAAITAILLAIALTASATVMIALRSFRSVILDPASKDTVYEKLQEMQELVDEKFHGTVDEKALQDAIAAGYIEGLNDPYASYLTVEEYAAKKLTNAGTRIGIGISLMLDESGNPKITEVVEGGSAEETGILAGDILTAVDGIPVADKTLSEITGMITGEENTEVVLSILRDSKSMEYAVIRKRFDLQTVEYEMMDRIGYLAISGFNNKTAAQFQDAITALEEKGAVGLIFDVRNNGGGVLNAACLCLDILVGEGEIATAMDSNGEERVLYRSDSKSCDLPMVVLQNGNTASAAELFSATLRDYGKASIVGTSSYGKGVMQTTYELSDGSAISFTTAKFVPYSKNSFHGIGIAPTYEVSLTKEQEESVLLGSHEDDPQLAKAIEILDTAN